MREKAAPAGAAFLEIQEIETKSAAYAALTFF